MGLLSPPALSHPGTPNTCLLLSEPQTEGKFTRMLKRG